VAAKKTAKKSKKKAKNRGTPDKFTKETVADILAGLRLCMPRKSAAEGAGISARTITNWMGSDEKRYAQFQEDVRQVEANAQKGLVAYIIAAAKKDWKAAAWLLERTASKHWGFKANIAHGFTEPTDIAICVSPTPQAQARLKQTNVEDF